VIRRAISANVQADWRFVNCPHHRVGEVFCGFHASALARQPPRRIPVPAQRRIIMARISTPAAASAALKLERQGGISINAWALRFALTILATIVLIGLSLSLRGSDAATYVTPRWAIAIHLATVIPGIPLGAWVLRAKKGTAAHRMAGRIWAMMMVVTAIDSFWIRSVTGSISPIHLFSVLTLVSIPVGIYHIRNGNVRGHERAMRGVYIGLLVAGVVSLMPGRMLGSLLFG